MFEMKDNPRISVMMITALILITLSISTSVQGFQEYPWGSYGGDPRNSGLSPHDTSHHEGEIIWDYEVDRAISASPIIGPRDQVYVGTVGGYLYSLSSAGLQRWVHSVQGAIRSTPAIGVNDMIYVGCDDGMLYGISDHGERVWEHEIGGNVRSSPTVGEDGSLYIGSSSGHVYSFSPHGDLRWKTYVGGRITGSPALNDDNLYVGVNIDAFGDNATLISMDLGGEVRWNHSINTSTLSSPSIDDQGNLYIGGGNNLYSFEADGSPRWTFQTNGTIRSSASIGPNAEIYVTSMDKNLYALNTDGQIRWYFETGAYISGSPSICSDGNVFVGSADGKLYSLNYEGDLRSTVNVGENIISTPAIGSDGKIYFGTVGGVFYAVNGHVEDEKTPPIPVSVSVEVGADHINISWELPSEELEVDHFNIYRTDVDGNRSYLFSISGARRYYRDGMVDHDVKYIYRISSVDERGESLPSEPMIISLTPPEDKEEISVFERGEILLPILLVTIISFVMICKHLKKKREEKNQLPMEIGLRYTCPYCANKVYSSGDPGECVNCTRCGSLIKGLNH